ncbi:fimbrial protein [Collimonas fungivorans]|uniref:fimbrial protein n=1 Tax=Collimonas fungivorans TaxID=158899 RepID=UPI0026F06B29|nr:fimbrial protein [Collimonas fungivorans]
MTTVACSVTNTAVQVPLGSTDLSYFTGIGKTTPDHAFPVNLDCAAGTRVKITLDGTADNAAPGRGVVALTPSSSNTVAKGVGVQLLYSSQPVILGSVLDGGTAATAGAYPVNFIARYYQTEATVQPGLANAAVTFTMTYN